MLLLLMPNPAVTPDPPMALDRLFADLLRGGWLAGIPLADDPVALRMDDESGCHSALYFEELVREAVQDAERGRDPRFGDGPNPAEVGMVSLHFPRWTEVCEPLPTKARAAAAQGIAARIQGILRTEDIVGRTAPHTFAILFRGCESKSLRTIARRCSDLFADPLLIGGAPVVLSVVIAAVHGERANAAAVLRAVEGTLARRPERPLAGVP